jgi:hypothetical protein
MTNTTGAGAAVALVTSIRSGFPKIDDMLDPSRLFSEYIQELPVDELLNLIITLAVLAASPVTDSELREFAQSHIENGT